MGDRVAKKSAKIKKKKKEDPSKTSEKRELTHYVKDRVELMRQVFSIIRDRELTAMAPENMRDLDVTTIQEMLLDEVLGISSKRLRSVLDAYPCPSDTESSDESVNDPIETISLDSISSEEDDIVTGRETKDSKKDIIKLVTSNKKPKANIGNVKLKKKKSDEKKTVVSKKNEDVKDGAGSMTVLELLELQARARAIRAQLAAVEIRDLLTNEKNIKNNSDSDEAVIIKEEPTEVVEIDSSDDDNRKKQSSQKSVSSTPKETIQKKPSSSKKQKEVLKPPRKVKLNRNNVIVGLNNAHTPAKEKYVDSTSSKHIEENSSIDNKNESTDNFENNESEQGNQIEPDTLNLQVDDHSTDEKHASDGDEISLELSDSEKMDVLEELQPSSKSNNRSFSKLRNINKKSPAEHRNYRKNNRDEHSSDDVKSVQNVVSNVDKCNENVSPSDQCTIANLNGNENDESAKTVSDDVDLEKNNNDDAIENDSRIADLKSTEENVDVRTDDVSEPKNDAVHEISEDSEDGLSNILSNEPTREEILKFSKKIDSEIEKENYKFTQDPVEPPKETESGDKADPSDDSNVTWKSRWLQSDKVKKVMATSNLCNALRKKNIELKKKLETDTNRTETSEKTVDPTPTDTPDEGSVGHYKTLTGSTRYVDPVKNDEKDMVEDAKQLMKMYKKLLRINDETPAERKERKRKKKEKKEKKRMKRDKVKSSISDNPSEMLTTNSEQTTA